MYRVLDKLEDDGILHSFPGINGVKWYTKYNNCSTSINAHRHSPSFSMPVLW